VPSSPKILLTDRVEAVCAEILTREGFQVDIHKDADPARLFDVIGEYDGLVVRSVTRVTSELLNRALSLKVIGRAGAGVDTIDVTAATRRGILVMNTPGGNTVSTAEHTMSLLLSMARNIPQACGSMREGKWERSRFLGTELCGKTLGIVGLGKIGREVAKRCQAFEMTVIGCDPVLSAEVASKFGIELVALEELLNRSDFITIHAPLNDETRGLIGRKQIELCKDGVRFVNCARGGIVEEQALLEALESGKVASAALDVFSTEPPSHNPLVHHPRVVVTPHLGASTEEAQEKVARQIAEQIADFFHGRRITGAVNGEVLGMALSEDVQPYARLAEHIGRFLAQVVNGSLKQVTVACKGSVLARSSELIVSSTMKGVLAQFLSEPVNLVNVRAIAKEIGITVVASQEDAAKPYANLLEIEYVTDREARKAGGTVFNGSLIRIVQIDGYHVEIVPEGYLLIYENVDRPGMLAQMGTILACENINIAGLSLGRTVPGERALTIMSIDSKIPDGILGRLRQVEGISNLKFVFL